MMTLPFPSRAVASAFVLATGFAIAAPFSTAAQAQAPVVLSAVQTQQLQAQLPIGLTVERARTHIFAPANTRNIITEDNDVSTEVRLQVSGLPKMNVGQVPKIIPGMKPRGGVPQPNMNKFCDTMHNLLKSRVTGYMLQVRKNGQPTHALIWNWAQTPADAGKGWDENTRMHVASVSKWITAVAMVKTLDAKGISYDAKIAPYLPAYWSKGNNIDKITFRHLLTHRSGFSTGTSSSDYAFMKSRVAAGVSGVGSSDYENMNFGLCRLLIPIINGNISKSQMYPLLNDQIWDLVTVSHYKEYCQDKVFTPAGVANASFEPTGSKRALAYKFPAGNSAGWNSGDLASMAGGAGWRLSLKELMNVMNTVRRKNSVLTAAKAQMMLDNGLGIDQIIDTPAGKTYNKNGSWGTGDDKREQCVAYFLPQGYEVAVFVNSKIGSENFSLRGAVQDAFVASL